MRLDAKGWGEQVNTQPSPAVWVEPFLRYTQPGQSILELGCAGGGLSRQLTDRLVAGLDFSQRALDVLPGSLLG
jgi:2-polyprenyl-3-methyl-5-hydroxy-6-metoxy-1,4-benzoquinol methylase